MPKPKIEQIEEYKRHKKEKHEEMLMKQRVSYSIKRKMSESRIRDFYREATRRGYNCHVSVGGLDSIVLCYLIREMGYDESEIKFVSASTQPETAKRIVGKSRGGMTLWYQCNICNEPVDAQDNFCRGCGRRLTDG